MPTLATRTLCTRLIRLNNRTVVFPQRHACTPPGRTVAAAAAEFAYTVEQTAPRDVKTIEEALRLVTQVPVAPIIEPWFQAEPAELHPVRMLLLQDTERAPEDEPCLYYIRDAAGELVNAAFFYRVPHVAPRPNSRDWDATAQAQLKPEFAEQFLAFYTQVETLHAEFGATYGPFIILSVFATRADQQGRGLGSITIRKLLSHADALQLPVYLDSSSEASRRMYERHGFQQIGVINPTPGTTMFSMARFPQPPAAVQ